MFIQETIKILVRLGFTIVCRDGDRIFLDSSGKNKHGHPVIQIHTYRNDVGTISVDAEGFFAPVICNEKEFVGWLDEFHPGWKAEESV